MSTTEQQPDDVTGWFQRLTEVIARTTSCSAMARRVLQRTAQHRSRLYNLLHTITVAKCVLYVRTVSGSHHVMLKITHIKNEIYRWSTYRVEASRVKRLVFSFSLSSKCDSVVQDRTLSVAVSRVHWVGWQLNWNCPVRPLHDRFMAASWLSKKHLET